MKYNWTIDPQILAARWADFNTVREELRYNSVQIDFVVPELRSTPEFLEYLLSKSPMEYPVFYVQPEVLDYYKSNPLSLAVYYFYHSLSSGQKLQSYNPQDVEYVHQHTPENLEDWLTGSPHEFEKVKYVRDTTALTPEQYLSLVDKDIDNIRELHLKTNYKCVTQENLSHVFDSLSDSINEREVNYGTLYELMKSRRAQSIFKRMDKAELIEYAKKIIYHPKLHVSTDLMACLPLDLTPEDLQADPVICVTNPDYIRQLARIEPKIIASMLIDKKIQMNIKKVIIDNISKKFLFDNFVNADQLDFFKSWTLLNNPDCPKSWYTPKLVEAYLRGQDRVLAKYPELIKELLCDKQLALKSLHNYSQHYDLLPAHLRVDTDILTLHLMKGGRDIPKETLQNTAKTIELLISTSEAEELTAYILKKAEVWDDFEFVKFVATGLDKHTIDILQLPDFICNYFITYQKLIEKAGYVPFVTQQYEREMLSKSLEAKLSQKTHKI